MLIYNSSVLVIMQSPTRIQLSKPLTTAILSTKESSSSGPSAEKIIPIVISLSGFIYGVGLFAANLGFHFMGFQDLNIPHQQCIETGIGFVCFCAAAMAPGIVSSIVYRLPTTKDVKWRRVIEYFAFGVICFYLLWILSDAWVGESKNPSDGFWAFRRVNQPLGFLVLWLGIFSLGLGSWLNYSLFDLHATLSRITPFSEAKIINLLTGLSTAVTLILLLFPFTILVFYQTPAGLGGGGQQHKDLWFSADAFQILSENGLLPKGAVPDKSKPQLLKVSNVQVLHEGTDSTVMCAGYWL